MTAVENQNHRFCTKAPLPMCRIECMANLTLYLNKYLDELSRVFFQKQDMRSKSWWLSIFYSFCIQAVVRKALISITGCSPGQRFELTWVKEYLHLAIRPFISASGSYDPLLSQLHLVPPFGSDGSSQSENLPALEDYVAARTALDIPSEDFGSSADYLKRIFEDSGEPLPYDTLPQPATPSLPIGLDSASSYGFGDPVSSSPSRYYTQSQNQRLEYQSEGDYSSSNCTRSTASSAGSGHILGINRMSIDGRTNPHIGGYQCTYPGCTARPFQTQVGGICSLPSISSLTLSSTFSTAMRKFTLATSCTTVQSKSAQEPKAARASREKTR